MQKIYREYVAVAREMGATVCGVESGGKHAKLKLSAGGKRIWFPMPSSTSDVRGMKNFRSDIRRWLDGQPLRSERLW